MKRTIAFILLLVMMVPALIKLGIVGNYLVQYNHYVTVLCENKDKPALECNGKCHLVKELKVANAPIESPILPSVASMEPVFFMEDLTVRLPFHEVESDSILFHAISGKPEGFASSIFQPPRFQA